jgi:recombination protein RecA
VAPPFKKLELPVMFNRWYDLETDLIESAMIFNIITRAGAFYTLGETKVQWRDKLRVYLVENEDIRNELSQQIQKHVSNIRMWKADVPEIDEIKAWETIDDVAEELLEE